MRILNLYLHLLYLQRLSDILNLFWKSFTSIKSLCEEFQLYLIPFTIISIYSIPFGIISIIFPFRENFNLFNPILKFNLLGYGYKWGYEVKFSEIEIVHTKIGPPAPHRPNLHAELLTTGV